MRLERAKEAVLGVMERACSLPDEHIYPFVQTRVDAFLEESTYHQGIAPD
jgi:hypothetical protein